MLSWRIHRCSLEGYTDALLKDTQMLSWRIHYCNFNVDNSSVLVENGLLRAQRLVQIHCCSQWIHSYSNLLFSPNIYFYRANQYTFYTFSDRKHYKLIVHNFPFRLWFLTILIIKHVSFLIFSEYLCITWNRVESVLNLFIQSAAKCTCTNFILQKSETFLCQSLGNHWKTFPQQRRENHQIANIISWQNSLYCSQLSTSSVIFNNFNN
jgi:hypothetical protein